MLGKVLILYSFKRCKLLGDLRTVKMKEYVLRYVILISIKVL